MLHKWFLFMAVYTKCCTSEESETIIHWKKDKFPDNQDTAEFPVHFPASILDKFRNNKDLCIGHFSLYSITGMSEHNMYDSGNMSESRYFLL